MGISENLIADVKNIFSEKWTTTEGRVVPETENIALGNAGIELEGTVLYADLEDSTGLVMSYKPFFAAEIYKAYLATVCKVIRANSGEITAFDGDRVMAVFIGGSKNSNAAKTALQINYVTRNILNPKLKEQYPNSNYEIKQAVGVDTSKLLIARTGIRGANDLVWVGRAANYAAKLCSQREDLYPSFITEDVYSSLSDETKNGGNPKQNMWQKTIWPEKGIVLYKSSWHWQP